MAQKSKVFVGLSGGVDSSVAAYRLIRAGCDVTGVFIKTWQPDFIPCTWEAERLDAMRVAAHLNIPFLTFDAEEAYRRDVAEYMIGEYQKGRTPNPDVMCNRYVKFGAFLTFARSHGASHVATGHYARVEVRGGKYALLRGKDTAKDQSYFLWTLGQDELAHTLFPIGDTVKALVREEAEHAKIPTCQKSDSQGICFLGQIDMKDFLSHYIKTEPGDVLDTHGNSIGKHDGALYYTIGQRHGFSITAHDSQTQPRYVLKKDLVQNTLIVGDAAPHTQGALRIENMHSIRDSIPDACEAQFRYRQQAFPVRIEMTSETSGTLTVLHDSVEEPGVGQSCVLYTGEECLGGGIIEETL